MNEAEEKRMLDAFEESGGGCREYQVDADDPMVQHELTIWKAAWKAALAYQEAKYQTILTLLNTNLGLVDSWEANGCEHGFKPAKDCPNPECDDAKMHRMYLELVK